MMITTLSPKHQTTVCMEHVRILGWEAGTRLKQWVEGNRIVMEPVPDITDSFGVFSSPAGMPHLSPREEKETMELAIATDVMERAGKS